MTEKSHLPKHIERSFKSPLKVEATPTIDTVSFGEALSALADGKELRDILGTKTIAAALGISRGALYALGEGGGLSRSTVLAMPIELESSDAVEAMLSTQIGLIQASIVECSLRCMESANYEARESYNRMMARMLSAFSTQVETLMRYRKRAKETVRVGQVTINDGGQAIIGNVTHGGNPHER